MYIQCIVRGNSDFKTLQAAVSKSITTVCGKNCLSTDDPIQSNSVSSI
jgi:hypothetical protein